MRTDSMRRGPGAAGLVVACLLFPRGALAAERESVSVTLELTAPDVAAAATRLRAVFAAHPQAEQITFSEQSAVSATLRVPDAELSAFVEAAAAIGTVTQRELVRTDLTATIEACARQRRSLQADLERLQRAKADDADEAIRLADAIRQRRAESESNEAECRIMDDGDRRATVFITVFSAASQAREAEPHFFPGVRFTHLFNAGRAGTDGLFGLGLSAQFADHVTFEVDLLRSVTTSSAFLDGLVMSAGFDTGSAILGPRRFFNPHLGIRLGVSALTGRVDFAAGATAGVSIVRLQYFQLDAQVRLWGFFGNRDGAHLGVQSGVVAMVGF